MTYSPPHPELCAQAELLTYLVLSQLLVRHFTGKWLTVQNVVESTHLWLHANGDGVDWLQRVSLASHTQDLAEEVIKSGEMGFYNAKTLGAALLGYQRLNHQSPAVAAIYKTCFAFVVERHSTGDGTQSAP
jgi:hypothetical protein